MGLRWIHDLEFAEGYPVLLESHATDMLSRVRGTDIYII